MKILIVNKFLYPRGGDCIYCFNLRSMLENHGHQVEFFSMQYPENRIYPENARFAPEVSFTDTSPKGRMRAVGRIFGWGVTRQFTKVLRDFNPDIVHLNNIHSYLSPIVARLASERKIKVVWTLHDYKLVCPAYTCCYDDRFCTDCIRSKKAVVSKRCMKGNLPASLLGYLENSWWTQKKNSNWIDRFICPSKFVHKLLLEAGYSAEKLAVIPNFISDGCFSVSKAIPFAQREKAYCYIGRLEERKGIIHLLNVAKELPYTLYIAGDGEKREELKAEYASDRIVFLGRLSSKEIMTLFQMVRFSVLPSMYFENNPLAIIESLCCGTPVVASEIGGIPELINKQNGILFPPGNEEKLKTAIISAFEKANFNHDDIRNKALLRFNEENYYMQLMNIYNRTDK